MTKSAYQLPEIYEIAFGFRDYVKAVDFIVGACQQSGLEEIQSMVELGCGPGQYCREFARRSIPAWGVDSSPQMIAYASEKCRNEKLPCALIEADMRRLFLPRPVSLAVCMMDSLSCLLTNQDPAAVPGLIAKLPPKMRRDLAALDLKGRDLARLRAKLFLIHGRDDAIIPYTESAALAAALPEDQATLYLVDNLSHVELGPGGWFDGLRLWSLVYHLLEVRDAAPRPRGPKSANLPG